MGLSFTRYVEENFHDQIVEAAEAVVEETNYREILLYDMADYSKPKLEKEKPLENGTFTLTQNGIELGTFTSDENGRITILYSNDGTFTSGAKYVLTQTAAPGKYIKTPFSVEFTVNQPQSGEGETTINVIKSGTNNESPGKWADGIKENSQDIIADINIYNKFVELKAVKVDSANAGKKLGGAKFSLYRGVNGIDGMGKDNVPLYSGLVSDSNGIIPGIDMNLPAGTYYLSEEEAPANYCKLEQDIVFTIHQDDGTVTLDSNEQGETLPTPDSESDVYSYEIHIPNISLGSDYYFDIEKIIFVDKNIHDNDKEQKFVFKVERFEEGTTNFTSTLTEVFYVTMNCYKEMTYTYDTQNNKIENIKLNTTEDYHYSLNITDYANHAFDEENKEVTINYTGNNSYTFPAAVWNGRKTIHVQKDGIYRVSEVKNWSVTDYDFWKDSNVYKGYGTPIAQGQSDGYVTFSVTNVKADQFKNDTDNISGAYRPTASFTNSETEFAYLSSQAYAENTIKR